MFVGEALIQVNRMMIGEVEAEGCSIEIVRPRLVTKAKGLVSPAEEEVMISSDADRFPEWAKARR
jgi:hypothetical protein